MYDAVNRFRARLTAGETCIGASITFEDAHVSDAIGSSVDFLWIDLEHGSIRPDALHAHFLAARVHSIPALVRVAGSTTPFIKSILDSGADGIIVPQVRSADEVRQVVNDCRYPPQGLRGYGPRVPSNYGRDGGTEFIAQSNRSLFVSVQIENVAALDALDEIAAVEGLDSIVVGPWDLSASMGHTGDPEHPDVVKAIDRIIDVARQSGLYVGTGMGPDADYALKMAGRGIQWLQVGGDYSYLVKQTDELVSQIRRRLSS